MTGQGQQPWVIGGGWVMMTEEEEDLVEGFRVPGGALLMMMMMPIMLPPWRQPAGQHSMTITIGTHPPPGNPPLLI